MKISLYLDNILLDLKSFEPNTLTSIVDFVRNHCNYNTISMIVRNSKKSTRYLLDQCLLLMSDNNHVSDIQLAGLLVIVSDVDGTLYSSLLSRISFGVADYRWSQAMAASYFIHKEVFSETVCESA